MYRTAPLAALVVSLALAGCGEKKPKAVQDPDTPMKVEAPKPGETPKPAAAPEAAWSSKDAKGFDWAPQMGAVKFDTDWKRAMAQAKKSGKPLVFLFTEKKNADTEKMAAVLKDARVTAALTGFVPALVDNEANAPLAERYGVGAVPMLVFASPPGETVGSSLGVTNADEVLSDIRGALMQLKEDADEGK
jgi:hypothetical protein